MGYEGLPVLSMAQAEAMDFRPDLERSAERCSVVRLAGELKDEHCQVSRCV